MKAIGYWKPRWMLLLLPVMNVTFISAQDISSFSIGLLPYTFNVENISESYAAMLQEDIVDFIEKDKRFILSKKDGFSNGRLTYERQDITEVGKLYGAQYLISLYFHKISHKTRKGDKKIPPQEVVKADFFYTDIQFSVRIYDVATGELRADEIIFSSSGEVDLVDYQTKEQPNIDYDELIIKGYQASDKEMRQNVNKQVRWYFDKVFPFSVMVTKIDAPTSLGSCIVTINGGKDIGVSKNGYYVIYTKEDHHVGEKNIKRKVDLAKAYSVKSLTANTAELKVFIGKKALIDAYNNGITLYCSPVQSGLDLNPQQIISMAISPFSLKEEIDKNEIEWLEEFVTNSIIAHGRLKVVERKNMDLLSEEREFQKTDVFIDAQVVDQGMGLGADYMFFGEAYEFRTWYHTQRKSLEPQSGFYTNLRVGIKLVDVATGKVEIEKIIKVQQHGGVANRPFSSVNQSQKMALYTLKEKVNRLLLQTFPLELEIVQISNANKKGVARNVLINGGSAYGLHMRVTTSTVQALAGTPFEVFEVREEMINGQVLERLVQIGEIVLKDVENDLISECRVRNGGDVIYKNFMSGKRMICKLKEAVISD